MSKTSIRRQTFVPSPSPSRQIFTISAMRPLLLVVIDGGRIEAVGTEYGMQVVIDTRILEGRAGTPVPKQLNAKSARVSRKGKKGK